MKPVILAASIAWAYAGFAVRPRPPAAPIRPALPSPIPAPRPPEPPATTWIDPSTGLWEGRGARTGQTIRCADRATLEARLPEL